MRSGWISTPVAAKGSQKHASTRATRPAAMSTLVSAVLVFGRRAGAPYQQIVAKGSLEVEGDSQVSGLTNRPRVAQKV